MGNLIAPDRIQCDTSDRNCGRRFVLFVLRSRPQDKSRAVALSVSALPGLEPIISQSDWTTNDDDTSRDELADNLSIDQMSDTSTLNDRRDG